MRQIGMRKSDRRAPDRLQTDLPQAGMRRTDMHQGVSLYLDLLRFIAAVEVFAFHLIMLINPLGWQPLGTGFGHEAVIVFFVLSGYVISYAAVNRDRTVTRYAISRLTRVYSVAAPALVLTVTLDHFGYTHDPALYAGFAPMHSALPRFVISLFGANETWFSVQAFSNGPYWSLCYELDYYVILGAFCFFTGWTRVVLLAAGLLACGIRPVMLLPVWLMGSWAFFETSSQRWPRALHCLLFLLPVPALWCYTALPFATITVKLASGEFGWATAGTDMGHSRQMLSDWYLGTAMMMNFLGAKNLGPWLARALAWVTVPIRVCADYTFTLYLVHLPILLFVAATLGWLGVWLTPVIVLAVGGATVSMGYLTERQRHRLKQLIERRLGVRAAPPQPAALLP